LLKEIFFLSLRASFKRAVALPVGADKPIFKKLSIIRSSSINFIIKVVLPVPGPP